VSVDAMTLRIGARTVDTTSCADYQVNDRADGPRQSPDSGCPSAPSMTRGHKFVHGRARARLFFDEWLRTRLSPRAEIRHALVLRE